MARAYTHIPPIEFLWECFDLDAATGRITWRIRPAHHFEGSDAHARWNGRFAGVPADSSINAGGYRMTTLTYQGVKRLFRSHRIVYALSTGTIPARDIDHQFGHPASNIPNGLREATHAENHWNRPAQRNNQSGLKGVSAVGRRFFARITCNGRRRHLGCFGTAGEAHAAYAAAAKELHGEFANSGNALCP